MYMGTSEFPISENIHFDTNIMSLCILEVNISQFCKFVAAILKFKMAAILIFLMITSDITISENMGLEYY